MNHKKNNRRSRFATRLIAALAGLVLTCGTPAQAEVFEWTGAHNNVWNGYSSSNTGPPINLITYATNWLPNPVVSLQFPTIVDDVIFGNHFTLNTNIDLNGDRAVNSLQFTGVNPFKLDSSSDTLTLNSGDLTTSGSATHTINTNIVRNNSGIWSIDLNAPLNFNGALNDIYHFTKQGPGTLTSTSQVNVASTFVHNGTLNVTGASTGWNSSSDLFVGEVNTATLNILDGAAFINNSASINSNIANATVNVNNATWNNQLGLKVGDSGQGTVNIQNGGLLKGGFTSFTVGQLANANGTVTVSGNGSEIKDFEVMTIGNLGQGTLNINSGADVNIIDALYLGNAASGNGTVNIDGDGSSFHTFEQIVVGRSGTGVLNIQNGGQLLHDDEQLYIGDDAGSSGTVTVDGPSSVLHNDDGVTYVGNFGNGILNIQNGSKMSVEQSSLRIGHSGGSDGTVNVTGTGSEYRNRASITVGSSGTGALNITDGAYVETYDLFIGRYAGANGTISISGTNSTLKSVTNMTLGTGGIAHIDITNGGKFIASEASLGSNTTNHTVLVSGAGSNWTSNNELYANGVNFTVENGATAVFDRDAEFGGNASILNITGPNTSLTSDDLYIGDTGTATLNISNGATHNTTDTLYVGDRTSSQGIINVSGANSSIDSTGTIILGVGGKGTLNVVDGATATFGNLTTAEGAGSEGQISVSGNSSAITITGRSEIGDRNVASVFVFDGATLNTANTIVADFGEADINLNGQGSTWNMSYLTMGQFGSASIEVRDGAQVNNTQSVMIGDENSSTNNNILLRENATWNMATSLTIARRGVVNFNIHWGASVTANSALLADQSGSTTTLNIQNTTSSLNITNDITIANSGTANLNILDGSKLTNQNANVAQGLFGLATITVDGNNSTWTNQGNLALGHPTLSDRGTAHLTISNGGTVTVGGQTNLNDNSHITINDGHFTFNQISMSDFNKINISQGTLVGNITNDIFTDASTLIVFQNNPLIDASQVTLNNQSLIFGHARLNTNLINDASGEIQTSLAERMHFTGPNHTNAGTINNFGGTVQLDGTITNTGLVAGQGVFRASSWTNEGTMAFSGSTANILGDFNNNTGSVITTGNATTTFWDDVTHNGTEIKTAAGSSTVFFGSFSGSGNFTGTGDVYFESDLKPGNSPGLLSFEGNVHLTSTNTLTIELGGDTAGIEFDQLSIGGAASLDGNLIIDLINGYIPEPGQTFEILNFSSVSGIFDQIITQNAPLGLYFDLIIDEIDGSAILQAAAHLLGDANLDGIVNIQDLGVLASNFNNNSNWFGGDFNDDGNVNIQDLALLASNFNNSVTPNTILTPSAISSNLLSSNAISSGDTGVGGASVIPTPSSLALLALSSLTLLRRRKP